MATESQYPDAILVQSGLVGDVTSIDDDPDSPDGLWLTTNGDDTCTLRCSFPTPTGNPNTGTGLQEFRLLVRKNATGGGDPTMTVEVYDNGSLHQTLVTSTTVTATGTGTVYSYTWDASGLSAADGSTVEIRVTSAKGGGGPNERNLEVGALEWVVDYSTGITLQANTGSFGLTGTSASFLLSSILDAETASFSLSGQAAQFTTPASGPALVNNAQVYSNSTPPGSGTTSSFNVTGGTGSVIIAVLEWINNAAYDIRAANCIMSWNGNSMTRVVANDENSFAWVGIAVFVLQNPTGANATFTFETRDSTDTASASRATVIHAFEFSGVNSTDCIGNTYSPDATTVTATSSETGSRFLTAAIQHYITSPGNTFPYTPSSDNTEYYDGNSGTNADGYNDITFFLGLSDTTTASSTYSVGGSAPTTDYPVLASVEILPGAGALTLELSPSTFSLTGQTNDILRALQFDASAAALTLSGQAATFYTTSIFDAETASFTLTGGAATFPVAQILDAETGTFSLTGQDLALSRNLLSELETATFSLIGQDVSFQTSLTLSAAAANFSLLSQDASFLVTEIMSLETGTFSLTGQAASFKEASILSLSSDSFVITGEDLATNLSLRLAASAADFNLTGQATEFIKASILAADTSNFSITAQEAVFNTELIFSAETATFTLTAQPSNLTKASIISTETKSFTQTGGASEFLRGLLLDTATASFSFTGNSTTFVTEFDPTTALVWLDPSDLTTLWQDTAGTIPVTASGQSVARIDNKGTAGGFLSQATSTSRPLYKTANGIHWLEADGNNDLLTISSRFSLGANPDLTVIVGFRIITNTSVDDRFWELGGPDGSACLAGGYGTGGWAWRFNSGNVIYGANDTGVDHVGTWRRGTGDTYGDSRFFLDGTEKSQTSSSNPSSTPTSTVAYFSIHGEQISGDNNTGNHRIYGLLLLNKDNDTSQASAETWMEGKLNNGIIHAAPRAFTLAGISAEFSVTSLLPLDTESFSLTGQSATFIEASILPVSSGTFTITGINTNFITEAQLTLETANFALSGQALNTFRNLLIDVETASFTLTGMAVDFFITQQLLLETSSFILTPANAALLAARQLYAETTNFSFIGANTNFISAENLPLEAGSFTTIGASAAFYTTEILSLTAETYSLSGSAAGLFEASLLHLDTIDFTTIGSPAYISTFPLSQRLWSNVGISSVEYGNGLTQVESAGSITYLTSTDDGETEI